MSATAAQCSDTTNSTSEGDDVYMFHAARQNGRRNALPDLGAQFTPPETTIGSCDVDQITPHFQTMLIKP
ncbi:unnamed protein product [Rotaria socialis]|uniref:Uncharacterized protein n=1 Tax=Rotaria socialis TaxID=392032 RepID=A0A821KS72_9BILA|nr:unnamed protein product [Rotaria socialis]CAF3358145.1 unnamed protein product [Rotaria socialis]CAF3385822.1 unnamed protein product [Rotaria socialis]CAF3433476.1 unnamed protein product [Rotaria socialis]CAF3685395.1 unnamed protein product [Rotaria socialis]